jgi:hypothetical protein
MSFASITVLKPTELKGVRMAKYGRKAHDKVEKAMRERKRGTLRSGSSGRKVTSRKQAIAIGLSEARRAGGKVPRRKSRKRSGGRKTSGSRKSSGGSRRRSSSRSGGSRKRSSRSRSRKSR